MSQVNEASPDTAVQGTAVQGTASQAAAAAAVSADPRIGLRGVVALRELLERLEGLQVAAARTQGWSWQEIALALGVSKQAVHKKHAGRRPASTRGEG